MTAFFRTLFAAILLPVALCNAMAQSIEYAPIDFSSQDPLELLYTLPPVVPKPTTKLYTLTWGYTGEDHIDCFSSLLQSLSSYPSEDAIREHCGYRKFFHLHGKISTDNGFLRVVTPWYFDDPDYVSTSMGAYLQFYSTIASHQDGLLFLYTPEDPSASSFTIELGDKTYTINTEEDLGAYPLDTNLEMRIEASKSPIPSYLPSDLKVRMITQYAQQLRRAERIDQLLLLLRAKGLVDEANIALLEQEMDRLLLGAVFVEEDGDIALSSLDTFLTEVDAEVDNAAFRSALLTLRTALDSLITSMGTTQYKGGYSPFLDTPATAWYTYYVHYVRSRDIISGYKDAFGNLLGEYRPANNVTIAEILKMFFMASRWGALDSDPELSLADDHWARGFVAQAEARDLYILRIPTSIDRPATRGEVVRTLLEIIGINPAPVETTSFEDLSPTHPHAAYIEYAAAVGVVSGDDLTPTFRPNAPINRAEMAKILTLMLQVFASA